MPHSKKQINSKLSSNKNSKNNIPPPPSQTPLPQSPLSQSGNIVSHQPSMIDSMKQGFSFGLGSSVAHNVADSFFKPKDINNNIDSNNNTDSNNKSNVTTSKMYELYNNCLEENDININCINILENK